MYGTPTMFVDMVNIAKQKRHDLSSIHSGIVAGAPVPFHLMQAMINDLNMRDAVVSTARSPLSVGLVRCHGIGRHEWADCGGIAVTI